MPADTIDRRTFIRAAAAAAGLAPAVLTGRNRPRDPRRPNVVYIMADDLGWGDLGCYGQQKILTPELDRMAADGVRFTSCYAGGTVCAPSRCSLLTGKHTGHARIRGNKQIPLRPEDTTIAEVMKSAGYVTGGIGKWGMGNEGTTGEPNSKGFDYWLGYLDRGHAHDYTPDYLWRNREKIDLGGDVYTPDLFAEESMKFVERHSREPFFLYLALTTPHANNELGWRTGNGMEVPSDEPYSDSDWPQIERNFAAMVTRMDRDIGRLLAHLRELGIDRDTLVMFTSDNGPHAEGGSARRFFPEGKNVENSHDPLFFDSNGPFRGIKRDLYEGGIRVPMIARWPEAIQPRRVSCHPWAFWDVMPTLAELSGGDCPDDTDGLSMAPLLTGRGAPHHDFLYWEEYDAGLLRAVRRGRWKAVRLDPDWPLELYDLQVDPGETTDIAAEHPGLVTELAELLERGHEESKDVDWFKRRMEKSGDGG